MPEVKINSKLTKIATIVGSVLLILMAFLHGSGLGYLTDLVKQSNIESFIKEIFPVLFVHPSIHLLGLAVLGILTLFMTYETKKVLFFISSLIIINAFMAFYLGAAIPGILLSFAAISFVFAGLKRPSYLKDD